MPQYGSIAFRMVENIILHPVDIHEYLNTSDKEKELLLSTNPKDYTAASDFIQSKISFKSARMEVGGWHDGR